MKVIQNTKEIDQERVFKGLNFSCDSYYSSQGRIDSSFDDQNESLFQMLEKAQPDGLFFEMENFQLFHLAKLSKQSVRAGAAAIPLANREYVLYI